MSSVASHRERGYIVSQVFAMIWGCSHCLLGEREEESGLGFSRG